MDIADIGKVANRKRISVEAEQLREKVSRETAKIIKLKVAQDTAYWDLKEKLQQLENNHERLQQNMVEVQMQHEVISGQYQEEVRLRPETLNKLSSTREICDVLEEYSERLKSSVRRCRGDQAALCDAYQRSARALAAAAQQRRHERERSGRQLASLGEKLQLTTEHQSQLVQHFTASKLQAEAEAADLRAELAASATEGAGLARRVDELSRAIDQNRHEIEKKDEKIASAQSDIKRMIHEFNLQAAEMKNVNSQMEKESKELLDTNAALTKALTNQETFAKSLTEENNQLQEKVAAAEEQQQGTLALVAQLQTQLQESSLIRENLNNDLAALINEKQELAKINDELTKTLADCKSELDALKQQLVESENAKLNIIKDVQKSTEEINLKTGQIIELTQMKLHLEEQIVIKEDEFKVLRSTSEEQIKALKFEVQLKEKDLVSKTSTISQLMSDIKNGTDARTRVENNLSKFKKELEFERDGWKDKEMKTMKQIEALEKAVRDKDDELAKQMSIILEMRSEKERREAKIESMQNMIDNVQKELCGRGSGAEAPREQPQHDDDNAVMLTPARKVLAPRSPVLQKKAQFAVPRSEPRQFENMLYNILSDSSMDSDAVDPKEVNRRFEAISRGEMMSPRPLASLKRRSGLPFPHGLKPKNKDDGQISLSQVRNKERTFFKTKVKKIKP